MRAHSDLAKAVDLHKRGDIDGAVKFYRKGLRATPANPAVLNMLGIAYSQQGDLAKAATALEKALALKPDIPGANYNLGTILTKLERHEEAIPYFEKAIALDPRDFEAINSLAVALKKLGRSEPAIANFEKALALRPEYGPAHYNLANLLGGKRQFEEAATHYRGAIASSPGLVEANWGLAESLRNLERYEEAESWYRKGLTLKQDDADACWGLGTTILQGWGDERLDEARAAAERALSLDPNHVDAMLLIGDVALAGDQLEDALAVYRRALEQFPNLAKIYIQIAEVLWIQGKIEEARHANLKAIELNPNSVNAYARLGERETWRADDANLVAVEKLALKRDSLPMARRVALDFTLAKAYADLNDYRRSFEHLIMANAGRRATLNYDQASDFAQIDRIETLFSPALLSEKSGSGNQSPLPIFIVGMPRSGSTLVEQILASHPDVHGGGELHFLPRVIGKWRGPGADGRSSYPEYEAVLSRSAIAEIGTRYIEQLRELAPNADRITDKMLFNYKSIGLIHLALPNARIIHTTRNPMDNCVSCFTKSFADRVSFSYDLVELGRYYRRYRKLMDHWHNVLPKGRILDVRYEDVVDDLEGQARRIVAHCGLEWDERCLSFYETERPIKTASLSQVRRPIYKDSIGRWHVYEEFLGPLREALELPGGDRSIDGAK